MEKHRGEIIERIVRKNNGSITQLSRQLAVSRNKIYEWFAEKELSAEVIYKIGIALNYDFSNDFPEFFKKPFNDIKFHQSITFSNAKRVDVWKDKYIGLLEKYSNLLS